MWFKVVKQTAVGSGWGRGPDGRSVGAKGYVTACNRGDPVGQGGFWPLPFVVLSPYPIKISLLPPNLWQLRSLNRGSGAGSTGVQTSNVGFWILSLWNPQLEPQIPDLFFHSISPTITCNTRLLTHSTEARVDVNARVLKLAGRGSGLISTSQVWSCQCMLNDVCPLKCNI